MEVKVKLLQEIEECGAEPVIGDPFIEERIQDSLKIIRMRWRELIIRIN